MSGELMPPLAESRSRACARFRDWTEETDRARARVEAAARGALAECYRFAAEAFAQPALFEDLCRRLGIRDTRRDRADNPYIRAVKAVFGREVEVDGRPAWEWIGDSQVNKYATILRYADARGIAAEGLEVWLSRDYGPDGQPVAMSLSRRLTEARAWFSDSAALPPAAPDAVALAQAVDRLPSSVAVQSLELRGLGPTNEASVILSLGDGEAVRLSNLPAAVLVEVLATIRRAMAQPLLSGLDRPLARLAGLFSGLRFVWRGGGAARVVNHADHCAVLVSCPGGPVARAEIARLDGVAARRVLAFDEDALKTLVALFRTAPTEAFDLANLARAGGLLAHRAVAGQQAMTILEVPKQADPGYALADFVLPDTAMQGHLTRDDLAAVVRLDSAARGWRRHRPSGRERRASRLVEVVMDDIDSRLALRRGGDAVVHLPLTCSPARSDRLARAELGAAARLLLARDAVDKAEVRVVPGVMWVLSGRNAHSGEALFIGLPSRDAMGKPVLAGLREARFVADPRPFSELFACRFGFRKGKH